jgi:steroid 5-alpha reductase family enzyme
MLDFSSYTNSLVAILVFSFAFWIVSVFKRDVSIVDSLWSLMFLLATLVYAASLAEAGPRAALILGLVTIWALRLSIHITIRNHGRGEDRRYRQIRANHEPGFTWKSVYIVFGLQGLLAWIISMPLLVSVSSPAPLGWLDAAGILLWLTGMVFEAGGDWQLLRFRSDAANRGRVLDTGLWRYTRHPNYFGEACLWWGYYLIALAGGGWWSLYAPALMTFLLLRVSGVSLLEKDIDERRPAYREYIERTNAFFPGPRREINLTKGVKS